MSGFSSIANPGGIPTSGGEGITPASLFKNAAEKAAYQRLLAVGGGSGTPEPLRVSKVKVKIFDLSDPKQVRKYEKLWAMLLPKVATGSVAVDHHKDLVHRADGTSYWMKYVEYVEFGGKDAEK